MHRNWFILDMEVWRCFEIYLSCKDHIFFNLSFRLLGAAWDVSCNKVVHERGELETAIKLLGLTLVKSDCQQLY